MNIKNIKNIFSKLRPIFQIQEITHQSSHLGTRWTVLPAAVRHGEVSPKRKFSFGRGRKTYYHEVICWWQHVLV